MTEFSNTDALLIMNTVDGLGIKRKHRLLEIADTPADLLNGYKAYRPKVQNALGAEVAERFEAAMTESVLDAEKDKLYKEGVTVVTYLDEAYPDNLKEIFEFPVLLYAKGNVGLLKTKCISVVGSRGASRYGVNVTRDFVAEFVRAGLTVVSGFARGIDSAAHRTVTEYEGKTIAVVASGLDICYPAENRGLMDKILSTNGLFVSEYRLGTFASQYNFPERNRIISGISDGLFVPEMRVKSGTMITVGHALEQGKTVCVTPGNINSPTCEGSNLLLKTMQGCIALSAEDVLNELGISFKKEEKQTYQLSLVAEQVMNALEQGETHFEDLISVTSLSAGDLQAVLTDLEMCDLIEKTNGNFYILK